MPRSCGVDNIPRLCRRDHQLPGLPRRLVDRHLHRLGHTPLQISQGPGHAVQPFDAHNDIAALQAGIDLYIDPAVHQPCLVLSSVMR